MTTDKQTNKSTYAEKVRAGERDGRARGREWRERKEPREDGRQKARGVAHTWVTTAARHLYAREEAWMRL
jgi:hypothetical protein